MWHPNGKYCNSVGRSQEHGCGSAGRGMLIQISMHSLRHVDPQSSIHTRRLRSPQVTVIKHASECSCIGVGSTHVQEHLRTSPFTMTGKHRHQSLKETYAPAHVPQLCFV
eukprot:1151768-Pelagomonas_calceolata.AAC.7